MDHNNIRFDGLMQYANLKIPFFQRSYVWEQDNWEDLLNSMSVNSSAGYLGTIILKREGNDTYIIDGQQRLTTMFILVRALHDYILKRKKEDKDKWSKKYKTVKSIFTRILFFDDNSNENITPRIEHSEKDKEHFNKIIGIIKSGENDDGDPTYEVSEVNSENLDENSLIEQCYDYFLNTALPQYDKYDKLSDIIDFLNFTHSKEDFNYFHVILLDKDEEEQIIFDSINNTGKGLTATDTIKNRIFHKLGKFVQNDELKKIYEDTWKKAFDCDNEDGDEEFWSEEQKIGTNKRTRSEILLHIYAVIKQLYDPEKHNLKELPKLYRKYLEKKTEKEIRNVLDEIKDYAETYKDLFDYEEDLRWGDYQRRLAFILDKTKISTLTPYLLYLVKENKDKSDFENLEKLVIRNLLDPNGSNKDYNKLCPRFIQNNDMVIEEANKVKNGDISLGIRNMKTNNYATAILFCIELYKIREQHKDKVPVKDLSLEHIMPQKWEEKWKDVQVYDRDKNPQTDNESAKYIRKQAIYSIGNMTILLKSKNSKAINKPFEEKLKEVYKKYSNLEITKYVKDQKSWDERNIYDRECMLAKDIIEIWGNPNEEEDVEEIISNNNCLFYKCDVKNGVDAVLKYEEAMAGTEKIKRYIVVKGSKIREDNNKAKEALKLREEKKVAIREDYILSADCSFTSPSMAARFVLCWGSVSGPRHWKNISEEEYNKWIAEHQQE